jgi:hypothetical protein
MLFTEEVAEVPCERYFERIAIRDSGRFDRRGRVRARDAA